MEFYTFNKDAGTKITKYDSDFIFSRIVRTQTGASIGCMHLSEGGVIGYHQAVSPQLLLILKGEGYVRSESNEYVKVQEGDAVFWQKDEWHETKSDIGLTAIVIESESLNPSTFMIKKS